jgi:CheY-like chemotaxis protein
MRQLTGGERRYSESKTVLAVDDDQIVLETVLRILQRRGLSVIGASGSADALALCERSAQPIDLLLTEVNLPFMTGAELARRIAEQRPAVPALFMATQRTETTLQNLLKYHPNGDPHAVIFKPFLPAALVRQVDTYLQAAVSQFDRESVRS